MSPTALAFVVTAAFLHATWNFLAKRIDTTEGGGPQLVFLYALLTVVLYTPLALFFLIGSHADWPDWRGWAVIALSALLHYGYTLVLQRGYRVGDLSVVYPLARGTGPLLSSLGAIVPAG